MIKVKGRATVLLPKSKEAEELSVGDQLLEDSSLLTYKNSYLQIKFTDNSVMNIGSQSKLILTQFDNQSNHKIANLIKGQLRKPKLKRKKLNLLSTQKLQLSVLEERNSKLFIMKKITQPLFSLTTVKF